MNVLFVRLARAGAMLALTVIMLGAWVRLTDAGLGCPDWPGCYGRLVVPHPATSAEELGSEFTRPLEAGKAWREMIHRYLASTLGLICVALAVVAWRNRRDPSQPWKVPVVLVALVIFQGLLGMWTVTLLLKPLIVTLHLAFGMLTLSMLWWLWLTLRRRSSDPWSGTLKARGGGSAAALFLPAPLALRRLALVALVALVVQILLGGWTSTDYAAVACPDLPRCQASWWPEADYGEGFVLWRGLGINYEGGVLDHPARVAIHFAHRLGAIVATLALLIAAVLTLVLRREGNSRLAAVLVLAALALQLAFGV
jgi:cytochrome c oxidase assembly protein subunit 15